jgi:phosphonate transport system substrate-binding protein
MRTPHRLRRFAGTRPAVRVVASAAVAALALSALAACGARDEPTGSGSVSGASQASQASGSSGSGSSSAASGASSSASGASGASGSAAASGSATSGSAASGSSSGSASTASNVCGGKSGDRVPTKLVLALVPSGDAKKLVDSVKPLTDALTKSLGIPVSGVVTQDYQAAVEAIGANQADIGFLPSLQMSQACDKYGAVPELQTKRGDASSYAAQFFTNDPDKYCADKPVDVKGLLYCNNTQSGQGPAGLDELPKIKGATFSFLQAASPAGYIFPAAALKKAGVDPATGVTPTTVTSNDASVLAVYNGDAEVGASYWDARTVVQPDTPDVGKKVVVFALTDMIPNDGVSLNGTLTKAWQDKITQALLDYAGTKAGVATLESIYQISGLTKADPAALQKTADVAASLGLG